MGRMCWRWHLLFRFQSFARVTFFCVDLSTFYRILSPPSCFPWPSWSAPPWVIAAAGRRNGFINRSFTSTTLDSFTGGEDKGKNDDIGSGDAARDVGYKRHFSKEQLEDSSGDWERQYVRSMYVLVHNMCCKSFSIRAPSSALKHFIDDLSGFWRWALENEGKSQGGMVATTEH